VDDKNLELEIHLPVGPSGAYNDNPTSGNISITILDSGSDYSPGEKITVPGSILQGIDIINNFWFVVDAIGPGGSVTEFHVENIGTSKGRASILGGTIDPAVHTAVWVEFKGRLTLKTITALERDPSIFTDKIAY